MSEGGPPSAAADLLGRHPPADPYPAYERLLAEGPVVWSEYLNRWAVLGYHAARQVLRDDAFLADDIYRRLLPRLAEGTAHDFAAVRRLHDCIAFFLDPPAHGPARRILASLMAQWPAARLRAVAQRLARAQLRRARRQGGFDLVADYARPIPGGVVAQLLGIPAADVPALAAHSDIFAELFDVTIGLRDYRRIDRAAGALTDYFAAAVRRRRAAPGEDGISQMIRAAEDQAGFGDDDIARFCAFMFFACQETTASFLSGGAATLFANPAAVAELRADPAKLPQAVDELLRHHSPVQAVGRRAATDRLVGGKRIAAGDRLAVFLGAANRDPAVWPAGRCPVLGADPPAHLAFGDGRHFCLGAGLARLEGIVAFGELLALPRVTFEFDEAVWAGRRNFRALVSLPVRL